MLDDGLDISYLTDKQKITVAMVWKWIRGRELHNANLEYYADGNFNGFLNKYPFMHIFSRK